MILSQTLFNITIKNSGSLNSENVILTVLDNDEIVEEKDLEEILINSPIDTEIYFFNGATWINCIKELKEKRKNAERLYCITAGKGKAECYF